MKLHDLEEMQAAAWRAFDNAVKLDDARLADPALSRFAALSNAVFLERMGAHMAEQSHSLARIATALAEVALLVHEVRGEAIKERAFSAYAAAEGAR